MISPIWLDIDTTDSTGREFDVEIQRADRGGDRTSSNVTYTLLAANVTEQ